MTDPAIASAELREVADGTLGDRRDTYPLAPLLDGSALRRYVKLKNLYPKVLKYDRAEGRGELPPRFEDSAYCHRLVATHGSVEAARAIRNGDVPTMSYLTGLTRNEVDFSIAQELTSLLDQLRRPGYLAQFAGDTDGGKTNTSFVMAGLAMLDDRDLQLATNVSSLTWDDDDLDRRTHVVESKSELEQLVNEYEDVIAVLDEMSTQANAQTANYEVMEEFYPIITWKSKYGLRLIIIGHRTSGNDIAPAIREHATHFIEQERTEHEREPDEYTARFYESVEDGEPTDYLFDLSPVPPVEAYYDPDERATFAIGE